MHTSKGELTQDTRMRSRLVGQKHGHLTLPLDNIAKLVMKHPFRQNSSTVKVMKSACSQSQQQSHSSKVTHTHTPHRKVHPYTLLTQTVHENETVQKCGLTLAWFKWALLVSKSRTAHHTLNTGCCAASRPQHCCSLCVRVCRRAYLCGRVRVELSSSLFAFMSCTQCCMHDELPWCCIVSISTLHLTLHSCTPTFYFLLG